jgi:hypothetical protein
MPGIHINHGACSKWAEDTDLCTPMLGPQEGKVNHQSPTEWPCQRWEMRLLGDHGPMTKPAKPG